MFLIFFYFILSIDIAFAVGPFKPSDCKSFTISKGELGRGILKHCISGSFQQLYLSGELDVIGDKDQNCEGNRRDRLKPACRDYRQLQKVLARIKKKSSGTFQVITENAEGGDVDWHQSLMMKVEDSCTGKCRIVTHIREACESACTQLHLTCAKGATTFMESGGKYCEHATYDDEDCHLCDPNNPGGDCNICDPEETVKEYTDRCDPNELLKGRQVKIDPKKVKQVKSFAQKLKDDGVFSSDKLQCVRPPWVLDPAVHVSELPANSVK